MSTQKGEGVQPKADIYGKVGGIEQMHTSTFYD